MANLNIKQLRWLEGKIESAPWALNTSDPNCLTIEPDDKDLVILETLSRKSGEYMVIMRNSFPELLDLIEEMAQTMDELLPWAGEEVQDAEGFEACKKVTDKANTLLAKITKPL
jgi:hypothetical protein